MVCRTEQSLDLSLGKGYRLNDGKKSNVLGQIDEGQVYLFIRYNAWTPWHLQEGSMSSFSILISLKIRRKRKIIVIDI